MGEIREGFLCPVCMLPCTSVEHLEAHFNANHFNSDKTRESSASDEAGQRIRPGDNFSYDIYNSERWQDRKVGVCRHKFSEFKKMRNDFMDPRAIESNKILMRLTKLVEASGAVNNSAESRREFERSVVSWVRDEDVPMCPSCGKHFNLVIRRRRHCRLCGAVMCNPCTLIIPFSFASALIQGCRDGEKLSGDALETLTSSLNELSVAPDSDSLLHVPVCGYCSTVLRRLTTSVIRSRSGSAAELLYSKLSEKMSVVTSLRPRYMQAVTCIQKGESEFSFAEATEMREKLLKHYQIIESLSTKIEKMLTTAKDPQSDNSQDVKVAKNVRRNAQLFLQQNLYALQTLPSREAYMLQRHNRKTALEQRIDREQKEAALYFSSSARNSRESTPRSSPSRVAVGRKTDAGWLPTSGVTSESEHEDPILTQMRQVQHFISQARAAGKMDEVAILEENLQHLQSCLGSQS